MEYPFPEMCEVFDTARTHCSGIKGIGIHIGSEYLFYFY